MAIRRRFCQVAERVIIVLLCKEDLVQRIQLIQALDTLKNDKDGEVSETAFDCDEQANIKYKESDKDFKNKKEREAKMLQYEQEMETRDI